MGSGGYHMDDPSTGMYNPGLVCDRREAPYGNVQSMAKDTEATEGKHRMLLFTALVCTPSGKQRWCMVLVILGVYSLREAPYATLHCAGVYSLREAALVYGVGYRQ